MPFPFQIDIIGSILKGLIIGVIASAPMGPVGVLCVQRTLNKGRWYGMATGIGAACSDIIYALITGLGMSFVMDFVTQPTTLFILKIIGSVVLLCFGIHSFVSNPHNHIHSSKKNKKGSLLYNGITAFWITFVNPLIIVLFMAAFAQLSFVAPDYPFEVAMGFVSIFVGALLWWFGLTWLVNKVRAVFDVSGIIIINRIIGTAVIVISLVILFGTVFNLYTLY